jgi:hypothetical protein
MRCVIDAGDKDKEVGTVIYLFHTCHSTSVLPPYVLILICFLTVLVNPVFARAT